MTRWRMLLALVSLGGAPAAWAQGCAVAGEARVAIAGTGRSVTMHWPVGVGRARPVPLVILLHGSGANGAAMLRDAKLAITANRHGFVVAAPDGGIPVARGFVWNIPGVPTIAGTLPTADDADDVAFLGKVIDQLATGGCVDRAKVYATGLSGGGRMTSWLGCADSDRFAAIAPVVGLRAGRPAAGEPPRPDRATCRPKRAVPVMAFAGDRDTTNPIGGGGALYWRYPMHAAEARWAQINGCTAPPTTRWVSSRIYEERYGGCRDGADVVARITVGGGHSWVADNEAMWAFLSQHRRD